MSRFVFNDHMMERVARRFRVLGEQQRLRILRCLEDAPKTVNEIATALNGNQSNISRHLQALFDAGLVGRRREGNSIYYSIADPMVFQLCALMCESAEREARAELELLRGSEDKTSKAKS